MLISAHVALWFLPFVVPLCCVVALNDLRHMRIPNWTVDLLAAIFVIVGPFLMSWTDYGWQLLHLPIGIGLGFLCYSAGMVGAGDAKFAGAAAPFVVFGDLSVVVIIFSAMLLAGFLTHRIAKYTPLRRLAPEWKSWDVGSKFPMGLCLGGTLVFYLVLGSQLGQTAPV
ncbi:MULTISPECIES: prepilin peptidase [Phaeobacter]|uniref:Flp pilus assembly protein, protease CpaA n=1 Tax=Phaeobacter piscinae TaxID=1580596 RepID=A0AAN1GNZ5_9RHOB|nr:MULTISPECIES: prepilin peptidase [Phaeobacter]ATG34695.1 Flp pilus assembly protein, protease CpaA [Phaeobacter piscinae]ATG42486.1 Flp pilus assembly protein, protease CpaA [Phaeobacter piscinae]AUQ75358.1 Flp pilus assembly protein, protease CpaA [Phaeobacter piscinae]AUQ85215.1 Flp pilus assembly protein, protease CpaA [Phaeobacter piscinae]AUR23099.1 Flp pilus assembly protein, protease CpaA [Phaeobacter piscinae]